MQQCIKALFLLLILSACENANDKTVYKPQSSGNINDLSVVIDSQLWESSVGESLRSTIGAPLYGLPQDEPQYKLRQIPSSVFSGFVQNTRLVLKVVKGVAADTKFYKDPYASPQRMVLVSGMTNQDIIDQLTANQDKIEKTFKVYEIKEKQRRFRKSLFNSSAITKQLGIGIQIPSIYRFATQEDDFFWFLRDLKTVPFNLLLYTVPYAQNISR